MLVSLYPLVVLLALTMGNEKLTRRNIIRLLFGFAGTYFLIGPGGNVDPIGILLIAGTILGYSLYLILSQWYMKEYPSRAVAFYVDATSATFLAVFGLTQGIAFVIPDYRAFGYILFKAIGTIGSGQIVLLSPLETLLTIIAAVILLNEQLSGSQWIGAVFVLTSAALVIEQRPKWVKVGLRRS